MTQIPKTCVICGAQFSVPAQRDSTATTCSQKCRGVRIAARYASKRAAVVCKGCGKTFLVPQCHAERRKFCSTKCAAPSRSDNSPKGDKHYLWKGGKASHCDGYLYLKMSGHPFGGHSDYVFEHRVIVENWMREAAPQHNFLIEVGGTLYLRPEISIHHINEVKSDNRRRNLLACTTPAHTAIHNGVAPMAGEVWPEIVGLKPYQPRVVQRRCESCGSEFRAKRCDVERGGGKFCSKKCFKERDRTKFKVIIT